MNRRWDWLAARTIGIAALIYCVVGLLLTLLHLSGLPLLNERAGEAAPYVKQLYFANIGVDLIFILGLFWGGIGLLRLRPHVVRFCNYLFSCELFVYALYLVLYTSAIFSSNKVVRSMAVTPGVGGGPIAAQIMTGFPLIALIVLNFARLKSRAYPEPRLS